MVRPLLRRPPSWPLRWLGVWWLRVVRGLGWAWARGWGWGRAWARGWELVSGRARAGWAEAAVQVAGQGMEGWAEAKMAATAAAGSITRLSVFPGAGAEI